MSNKKIDNLYAALKLIEILLEKGLINQATYSNIVKNAKSHIQQMKRFLLHYNHQRLEVRI